MEFPKKEKDIDSLKKMSNPNITQQRKHMEKQVCLQLMRRNIL
jgi:hypothetical protein